MPSIFRIEMSENSPGQSEELPRALHTLPDDLKRHLRSGVSISSLTQCIEELVSDFFFFIIIFPLSSVIVNDIERFPYHH